MGKKILVVDDSSMMRNMISGVLAEAGHTVVGKAKNGAEGVDFYKSLKPEVVTMDVTMRVMDGFAAAKEILDYDEEASIIFLSNLDAKNYKKDTELLGARGYVNKHKTREILSIIDGLG